MMIRLGWFLACILSVTLIPQTSTAKVRKYNIELKKIGTLINEEVRDSFSYSGLAAFYNGISVFVVSSSGIKRLRSDKVVLESNQSLAIVGHYNLLIVHDLNVAVSFDGEQLLWSQTGLKNNEIGDKKAQIRLLPKSDLHTQPEAFHNLKYAHLWEPFRILCLGIEALLFWLNSIHSFGWGISIILLSLLFKIFILPVNILLTHMQRNISQIQAHLAPKLECIKANYSGEKAHKKFMAAHKQLGVTPFYTLKPFLLTLTPVPFLIAIFNVLGEMDIIVGQSFLWIENLARPDAIYNMGRHIPLLGDTVNLLPILMTLLTIFAVLLQQNKIVTQRELKKQKRNLYFMAFSFFVLFYSFPSIMVLYWTFANIWQLIQQRFVRV